MDDEVSLLKKMLFAWVMGFAFALVLVERWRRMGQPPETVARATQEEPPAEDGETKPSPLARVRQIGSRAGESVARGMKADVDRVRETFRPAAQTSPRQSEHVEQRDGG